MGLDMYFKACTGTYTSYCKTLDEGTEKKDNTNYPRALRSFEDYLADIGDFKARTVTTKYRIGYFRKFNALHNYIVEHFAEGNDICQEIYLSRDNIIQLQDVCERILADHSRAGDLMPTAEGFFFGDISYGQYYFDKLAEAKRLFDMILSEIDFGKYYIEYQASW